MSLLVTIVVTIAKAFLKDPAMRALAETFFFRVFAELYFDLERDPKYKSNFLELAAQLKDPNLTVEARQNVLKRIQALHPGSA